MVKFDFYMLNEDLDRLFLEKQRRGAEHDTMNGNQFAKVLLHEYLRKLQPAVPAEEGDL